MMNHALDRRQPISATRSGLQDFDVRARRHRPRILVAEDDEDFRSLLAQWLEVDGYRVALAANGTALLERVAELARTFDPPALVIADDRMPGVRGSRALRSLREQGWSIPLILITAFGTEDLVAGVEGTRTESTRTMMLKKPFEIDDLRTLVGWVLPRAGRDACIACGGTDDVLMLTDRGSARFCGHCRDLIGNHSPPSELGGES